jgi:hypothetical protein
VQQFGADARLKERDGSADRGGGATKLATGGCQTTLVERGDEHFHCIDAVHDLSLTKMITMNALTAACPSTLI